MAPATTSNDGNMAPITPQKAAKRPTKQQEIQANPSGPSQLAETPAALTRRPKRRQAKQQPVNPKSHLLLSSMMTAAVCVLGFLALLLTNHPVLAKEPFRNDIAQKPPTPSDRPSMQEIVMALTTMTPQRTHDNVASLDAAASYIATCFERHGITTSEQTFAVSKKTYRNVIATFGNPAQPKLIIGAHYDACVGTPGADDNASGVAGLIQLAAALKAAEDKLTVQIECVAYSLEEPPYFGSTNMGSHFHAQQLSSQQQNTQQLSTEQPSSDTKQNPRQEISQTIIGMLCLEMIGYFSDQPGSQNYPAPAFHKIYPDTGNFIAFVTNQNGNDFLNNLQKNITDPQIPFETFVAPPGIPDRGIDYSDHRNYWKFGFPAIMITDTAFFRNPHYHKPTDTADTLNYTKMQHVVDLLTDAILALE